MARSTQVLYAQMALKRGLDTFVSAPSLFVSEDGDALSVAGEHWHWGFCWCQPRVTVIPHGNHEHRQVTHRRVMDDTFQDHGRWAVDSEDGMVTPLDGPRRLDL